MDERPLIALTLGDPAGIGPEIVRAAARDGRVRAAARLLLVGPPELRDLAPSYTVPVTRSDLGAGEAAACLWIDAGAPGDLGDFEHGRVQARCGRAALSALELGATLAAEGRVDALVTAPVNKEALHRAGEPVEGQTELLARWAGAERCQMLAVAGDLRVLLATRHMALRAALDALTPELVLDHLLLLDEGLRGLGFAAPRLALAGLNPHAGEGGIFGDEEARVLAPALAAARARGLDVAGPEAPDTVFLRGLRGTFDGVLALYHDQGFIPVKLAAPDAALTVLLGLPYLRVSPAHGTAFDIAGRGLASPENLVAALLQAAAWAVHRASSPRG